MMQSTLRSAVSRVSVQGAQQQKRGMATNPNDILKRITSTKSIAKITKSMKMVSAAKLRGDTQRLLDGRPFMTIMSKLTPGTVESIDKTAENAAKKPFLVAVSSDRGLCGGVNSYVTKKVKAEVEGTDDKLFIIGEKSTQQLSRTHGSRIVSSVDENWKQPMNFAKACNITQRVMPAMEENDAAHIVFNQFVSAIVYNTLVSAVPNFPVLARGEGELGREDLPEPLNKYEIEPDVPEEFLQNVFEYTLACQVYSGCVENATSEQSARMSAMDNATKNAGEMIDSLTVIYNRARQARITTELNEIISGAESLKD